MEAAQSIFEPLSFQASDGYTLHGLVWRHPGGGNGKRWIVIINPATSVKCRYYARFADFLYAQGLDVLLYDYRGIGESRPASIRKLKAGWLDWGRLDFEAALQYTAQAFPGQPLGVIGHSVGGFLIGLAPSSHGIDRAFTVGAQFAYWRDYDPNKRTRMRLKWHLFMPAITALLGYFPGSWLGWLEDTPRGVVRDWVAPYRHFEDAWLKKPLSLSEDQIQQRIAGFAAMRGDMLAVSLSDDEFGTPTAIRRLLYYFVNSYRTHLHLTPESIGAENIGHFAFFHERFQPTLWQLALNWFQGGHIKAPAGSGVMTFEPGLSILAGEGRGFPARR
ncbi:MAG: alpha/beta fold hydrolase [Burkholderiaceae bacterium]|jgi:predicted alpha/beta hydrolase|nr:alpha/beta fold hydrolase [Burkholderiaceae bacterium]